MARPQTVSPFPTVARKPANIDRIDPDMLTVEHNVQPPTFRARGSNKYDALFGKLQPGSSIRCEPGEVNILAQALRKCLEQGRYPALAGCKVLSRSRCPDGHARVWAMATEGGAA